MAIGVGLDWLPGLLGESRNGRRWPGVPTLPDDRDLLGDGGRCGRLVQSALRSKFLVFRRAVADSSMGRYVDARYKAELEPCWGDQGG